VQAAFNHSILFLILLLFASKEVFAQRENQYSPTNKYTDEEQLADAVYARKTIEAVHPDLYRWSSKATVDAAFDALENEMGVPKTDAELAAAYARLFSTIGCGHTFHLAQVPFYHWAEKNARYFPYAIHVYDDRLYVVIPSEMVEGTYDIFPVLELDGKSDSVVVQQLYAHIAADGHQNGHKSYLLQKEFAKYYRAYLQSSDTIDLLLKGMPAPYKVVGVPLAEVQRKRGEDELEELFLSFPDKGAVAWMRIPTFGDPDIDTDFKTYRKFLAAAFEEMTEKGTKQLVIDISGNAGGEEQWQALLETYLVVDNCFETTQRAALNECPEWVQQPLPQLWKYPADYLTSAQDSGFIYNTPPTKLSKVKNVFEGELYILQDYGTYSAAANFSLKAQACRDAKIYGFPTGGVVSGENAGQALELRLPNTNGRIYIPLISSYNTFNDGLSPNQGLPAIMGYAYDPRTLKGDGGIYSVLLNILRVARNAH